MTELASFLGEQGVFCTRQPLRWSLTDQAKELTVRGVILRRHEIDKLIGFDEILENSGKINYFRWSGQQASGSSRGCCGILIDSGQACSPRDFCGAVANALQASANEIAASIVLGLWLPS